MKRYKCHKVVEAGKIVQINWETERPDWPGGKGMVFLDNKKTGELVPIDRGWFEKHEPEVGGYFVRYADGYTSYSPAEAFESGYTEITESLSVLDRVNKLETSHYVQANTVTQLTVELTKLRNRILQLERMTIDNANE